MKCTTPARRNEERYPGFGYPAYLLRRFHEAAGLFTILLQNDHIIHYEPGEPERFRSWLHQSGVAIVE
ncbi:hypothetical protein [Taibaiella koreensis]|uniref:hypothetical protein n=1 Tax=Taibaiella koreensis TaxID=1268548 RepID=UPI000E59DE2A|nr:hypothetical protein [Taibaiella koreensis]